MVHFAEHAYNAAVVDTGNHDGKQIIEKGGMFLEIEGQSFVVATATKVSFRSTKKM